MGLDFAGEPLALGGIGGVRGSVAPPPPLPVDLGIKTTNDQWRSEGVRGATCTNDALIKSHLPKTLTRKQGPRIFRLVKLHGTFVFM